MVKTARSCWCQEGELLHFSEEYSKCSACHTLVSQQSFSDEQLAVGTDDRGFYGKDYWFSHQTAQLEQPDIYTRARIDLPERCAYWMPILMKYRLPDAKVLEVGAAHGGFVAMMRFAGYEAVGLDLSPWIVDFAARTFDIPMFLGPVEDQHFEPGSFDMIVLMDVFEHLPDPVRTMSQCLKYLKPDGILLIQTPQYPLHLTYDEMKSSNHPFLGVLKSDEHLYLFNEVSVQAFFQQMGVQHFSFEKAIFSQYDMFFAASRIPIALNAPEVIDEVLGSSAQRRMIRAIMDCRSQLEIAEADRYARFLQIEQLTQWLKEAEIKHNNRFKLLRSVLRFLKGRK